MPRRLVFSSLLAIGVANLGASRAADIDLFVATPNGASELPNVLFIIDNTANWSQSANGTTKFAAEMNALVSTFNGLPTNPDGTAKFNVGVMFTSETGNGNTGNDGAYVRAAVRPMTAANRAKYAEMIQTLDVGKDKGSGGKSSLVMAEAYRYFSSGAPYAGTNKVKADFTNNNASTWNNSYSSAASRTAMQAIFNLPGNALSSTTAASYTAPPNAAGCAKNFIIYMSNGPSQDNNSVIDQATSMLSAAGGNTTTIPLSPSGSQSNVSDEWARFMRQSSLRVTTYTIDVLPESGGQGPGWTAMLRKMAQVGDGKNFAVTNLSFTGEEITKAINDALSEILAANSVFASVSLPVSVNTQGTYLNQVFIGMFRPDGDAHPRWAGNLKQYKLGMIDGNLRLIDAADVSAINAQTGFITECARSFWTSTSADSYWAFDPQGGCLSSSLASDTPDGNIVEKGAHGTKLRSIDPATRVIATCDADYADCTLITSFGTGNADITEARLGASSPAERTDLINWAIGHDLSNENNANGTTDMRPSVHGDIVHSRPVAINFGTDNAPQVIVFYGGNDGVFRAINGNRSTAIGTKTAGSEMWAFIPPEFYSQIKPLRNDSPQVSFPGVTGGIPKPYGMDGVISALDRGSEKWIYGTMRRGGRSLYAFKAALDVNSNLTMVLKWKKGCPNNFPTSGAVSDADCSPGFTGIGQTWSSIKTFTAAGHAGPLLAVGGGYDTCEDGDPHTCVAGAKGNKIYILNADTGALLNTFDTDRSVVADIATLNDSSTGNAKFAYTADLGGNVYRIDMRTGAPGSWSIVKIASLGCATPASCSANRKFMYAPDIVEHNGVNYLMLGSGDREKPLSLYASAYATTNYFFMLMDRPTNGTWLSSESANCNGSSVLCLNSLLQVSLGVNPASGALANKKGWYLALSAHEQAVTTALTIYGRIYFSTHTPFVPVAGQCGTNLGTTHAYGIGMLGTDSARASLPQVGLPPSPVGGMVTLDDGTTVPFCIGCNVEATQPMSAGAPAPAAQSPLQSGTPPLPPGSAVAQPKSRVYWFIRR